MKNFSFSSAGSLRSLEFQQQLLNRDKGSPINLEDHPHLQQSQDVFGQAPQLLPGQVVEVQPELSMLQFPAQHQGLLHQSPGTPGSGELDEFFGSFECPFCPFRSNVKKYLDAHVRAHTYKRSFPCDVCPYVGAQLSNLKSHMRTHTGEKPYKCCVCERTFSHHHTLHGHYKTHANWEEILCPFCRTGGQSLG